MDKFLNEINNITYDFIGIFIPGYWFIFNLYILHDVYKITSSSLPKIDTTSLPYLLYYAIFIYLVGVALKKGFSFCYYARKTLITKNKTTTKPKDNKEESMEIETSKESIEETTINPEKNKEEEKVSVVQKIKNEINKNRIIENEFSFPDKNHITSEIKKAFVDITGRCYNEGSFEDFYFFYRTVRIIARKQGVSISADKFHSKYNMFRSLALANILLLLTSLLLLILIPILGSSELNIVSILYICSYFVFFIISLIQYKRYYSLSRYDVTLAISMLDLTKFNKHS